MKKSILAITTGLAMLLAGCVVTSIYPFYTEKDVVFDPALSGKWLENKEGSQNYIEFKKDPDQPQAYILATTEDNTLSDRYSVHLFNLGGKRFIDLLPAQRPTNDDVEFVPARQLMMVTINGKTATFTGLKYEWLADVVGKDPGVVRHIVARGVKHSDGKVDERIVLTASTKELQDFVVKNLDVKEAWGDPAEYKRPGAATP